MSAALTGANNSARLNINRLGQFGKPFPLSILIGHKNVLFFSSDPWLFLFRFALQYFLFNEKRCYNSKNGKNKTIFLPKSWLTVGPWFGLSLKCVKLKRR